MNKLTLGILATAFMAVPAFAADIPLKAPPMGAYPIAKCGLYYGINAEAGAGVVPNAPAGTTVIGGDIGGLIGYACPTSSMPWFAEVIVDFQNLNAGNNGFSLTGPVHLEQRAGVETPLIPFWTSLGGPSTGTPPSLGVLPPGFTVSGSPQNYVYAAINEDDISANVGLASAREWLISPEFGTGFLYKLVNTNKLVIVADTYAGVELQSNSMCIGAGMCPKLGTRFKLGTSFKY